MATRSFPVPAPLEDTAATEPSVLSEAWRVCAWRLAQLSDAGYDDDAAALLATRSGVDLHRATDLVRRGCPPETALRILL